MCEVGKYISPTHVQSIQAVLPFSVSVEHGHYIVLRLTTSNANILFMTIYAPIFLRKRILIHLLLLSKTIEKQGILTWRCPLLIPSTPQKTYL